MIVGPIGRRRNAPLVAKLQGLDASENLVHITTDAGGIVEGKHQLIFWIDDEDGTDGKGKVLFVGVSRIDHSVHGRDLAVGISNDRELHFNFILAMCHDVIEPILRFQVRDEIMR